MDSSATAFSGSTDTQLVVPSTAAATTGSVGAYLHNESFGSTSFSVASSRAASINVVLRTQLVYRVSDGVRDRDRVIVTMQLRDATGNSVVLRTGLQVTLQLVGLSPVTGGCSLDSEATGLATCARSVPDNWFSTASDTTASVSVTVSRV